MSDTISVQGENTPEHVAYKLMDRIFSAEDSRQTVTREEILKTYVQCLFATKKGLYKEAVDI